VPELAAHDGMVWYRRSFRLTPEQAAGTASLSLGGIDEVDQTWVNGRVIRNTFGWGTDRTYRLPAGTLRAGDNVVVVNVLSTWDAGGMTGPADALADVRRWDDRAAGGVALPGVRSRQGGPVLRGRRLPASRRSTTP
jgi:sialate O-acetylesterase